MHVLCSFYFKIERQTHLILAAVPEISDTSDCQIVHGGVDVLAVRAKRRGALGLYNCTFSHPRCIGGSLNIVAVAPTCY